MKKVSASTQNQALCSLLFLYRQVLGKDIEWIDGVVRAKRPICLPVVLTKAEVYAVLSRLEGIEWIMASLLYGAGLRLMECCRLRVKDIDFEKREIVYGVKTRLDFRKILPALREAISQEQQL